MGIQTLNRPVERAFDPSKKRQALGTPEAGAGTMKQIIPALD
jgi:hypothetical protein